MKIIDKIRAKRRAKASAMLTDTADNIKNFMESAVETYEKNLEAIYNDPVFKKQRSKCEKKK